MANYPVEKKYDYSQCPACVAKLPRKDKAHIRDPYKCRFPKCEGCCVSAPMGDPSHTRKHDECRYPYAATEEWSCPSCSSDVLASVATKNTQDTPESLVNVAGLLHR